MNSLRSVSWELRLGIMLVVISLAVYALKFLVLGDLRSTYTYAFHAMGFLPINVLLVTLFINRLLTTRANRRKLVKMNVVVDTFFSELGIDILQRIAPHDANLPNIRESLIIDDKYNRDELQQSRMQLQTYVPELEASQIDLADLKKLLQEKRNFVMRLLENPFLLEHEILTGLLRSVFHLSEELERRNTFEDLPDSDLRHLTGDVCRAYLHLLYEWLNYIRYLHHNYPYLFSLAMRTNPFDQQASVVIR